MAKTLLYLGIDPGLRGGYAALWSNGAIAEARPLPHRDKHLNTRQLAHSLQNYAVNGRFGMLRAVVERVHAMPKQGVTSTFTFGMGFGAILGVLGALGIEAQLVEPTTWKKRILGAGPRDKAGAIGYVYATWPDAPLIQPRCRVAHDGVADALCIAQWARVTAQER